MGLAENRGQSPKPSRSENRALTPGETNETKTKGERRLPITPRRYGCWFRNRSLEGEYESQDAHRVACGCSTRILRRNRGRNGGGAVGGQRAGGATARRRRRCGRVAARDSIPAQRAARACAGFRSQAASLGRSTPGIGLRTGQRGARGRG